MESNQPAQMTDRPASGFIRKLHVVNKMGIHARPATKIVELTNAFEAEVTFSKDGEEVDAKSVFGVMTLAATQGTVLTARARGVDAEDALEALDRLFQSGFDENGGESEGSGEPSA